MANSLGDIIRDLRKSKKITQEELADGICSSVSISRIENGTQMPSGSTLEKNPCKTWSKHISDL